MLISQNCSDIGTPNIEINKFPDGENYVRLLADGDTVVHRCYPGPNSSLFQLLQILDTLSETKSNIRVCIPYLIYARQERRVITGEAISARSFLKALNSFGVSELITFDCHFMKGKPEDQIYGIKIRNFSLAAELIDSARRIYQGNALVIAPDSGALNMGADVNFIKTRGEYSTENGLTQRKITSLDDSLVRKKFNTGNYEAAILIDDIIASGGTMIEAAKKCKEIGFKKVIVTCVHALYMHDSDKNLMDVADAMITTNTIRNRFEHINFFDKVKEVL